MGRKKPVQEEIEEMEIEVSPEQTQEVATGGVQTIMSIGLAEGLCLEDLRDRLFYLDTEVDDTLLHTVTMQILKINGMDYGIPPEDRHPIVLIVSSGGGSVFDGVGLMDAIINSATPVIGVCVSYAMSMAFSIFSVCHARFAMPNSIFLYHDGYETYSNTATKTADLAAFTPRLDKRINKMIAQRSKFTVKKLEKIAPHDNYWFADEMVEMGIVDGIIGKDISIGELFGFMSGEPCECDDDECDCHKK